MQTAFIGPKASGIRKFTDLHEPLSTLSHRFTLLTFLSALMYDKSSQSVFREKLVTLFNQA